ncbi:hypothetical protein RE6C_04987 [Rhodopirellula europaea 6C]|uniref:Uncharacterized protein n=1 Tax=Rhodopirellula europaea 6C TaxID=1263867 RepID=M2ACF9_9BACT|nr:hypothetical protein RE6C_04987 [Rhodopirellula europaea 6C]
MLWNKARRDPGTITTATFPGGEQTPGGTWPTSWQIRLPPKSEPERVSEGPH